MKGSRCALGGAAAAFVAILFYLTLESAPPNPPTGVEHNAASAERACRVAVRDSIPDAVFPFSANATYLGNASYHLTGTVDEAAGGGGIRRNYDCWIRFVGDGGYRTDSVTVWHSH